MPTCIFFFYKHFREKQREFIKLKLVDFVSCKISHLIIPKGRNIPALLGQGRILHLKSLFKDMIPHIINRVM